MEGTRGKAAVPGAPAAAGARSLSQRCSPRCSVVAGAGRGQPPLALPHSCCRCPGPARAADSGAWHSTGTASPAPAACLPVCDVEEAVLVLVLGVDVGHQRRCTATHTQRALEGQSTSQPEALLLLPLLRISPVDHTSNGPAAPPGRQQAAQSRGSAPVGGSTFLTNIKMAFSGLTRIRFLITYTNWPTVRSAGTRYLGRQGRGRQVSRARLASCLHCSQEQQRGRCSSSSRQPGSLLLVNVRDVAPFSLLHNHLQQQQQVG